MIGSFRYTEVPPPNAVALQLFWKGGDSAGAIHVPDDVALAMEQAGYPGANGEPMSLGLALGYGVTVAALTGQELRIYGDRSVWPDEWGMLEECTPTRPVS